VFSSKTRQWCIGRQTRVNAGRVMRVATANFIKDDLAKWSKVVKTAGIKPE